MSTKKFKWLAVELEGSAVGGDKQDEAAEDAGDKRDDVDTRSAEDAGDKRDDVDTRVGHDAVAVDIVGVSASRDL